MLTFCIKSHSWNFVILFCFLWLCSFKKKNFKKIILFPNCIFFSYPIICQFCQTISSCFDCFALTLLDKTISSNFCQKHFLLLPSNNLFFCQALNFKTFLVLLWIIVEHIFLLDLFWTWHSLILTFNWIHHLFSLINSIIYFFLYIVEFINSFD